MCDCRRECVGAHADGLANVSLDSTYICISPGNAERGRAAVYLLFLSLYIYTYTHIHAYICISAGRARHRSAAVDGELMSQWYRPGEPAVTSYIRVWGCPRSGCYVGLSQEPVPGARYCCDSRPPSRRAVSAGNCDTTPLCREL